MIKVSVKNNMDKMDKYLKRMKDNQQILRILDKYGKRGVELLSEATPVDGGETSKSWSYTIKENDGDYTIQFDNSNVNDGVNIAIILQYGHGTRNGGYVSGRDYINPALKQAFNEMQNELIKEVGRL